MINRTKCRVMAASLALLMAIGMLAGAAFVFGDDGAAGGFSDAGAPSDMMESLSAGSGQETASLPVLGTAAFDGEPGDSLCEVASDKTDAVLGADENGDSMSINKESPNPDPGNAKDWEPEYSASADDAGNADEGTGKEIAKNDSGPKKGEPEKTDSEQNDEENDGKPHADFGDKSDAMSNDGGEGNGSLGTVSDGSVSGNDSYDDTQNEAVLPDVVITIKAPSGWHKKSVKVRISAEDRADSGRFLIKAVRARIGQGGGWADITDSMELEISEDCTVYVEVADTAVITFFTCVCIN